MKSITTLYRVGPGPSSSHTLALKRACDAFKDKYNNINSVNVTLYGSISLTGKGHYSDQVIINSFAPIPCSVKFGLNWDQEYPHGILIDALDNTNQHIIWHVYSKGGGVFEVKEDDSYIEQEVYPLNTIKDINNYCKENNLSYLDYINIYEPDLAMQLQDSLQAMLDSVYHGLKLEGKLNGNLNVNRCAKGLYQKAITSYNSIEKNQLLLMSYAFAAAEQNACGQTVCTAPTLGSCGVMAALMYYCFYDLKFSKQKCLEGLIVGGLFGNVAKTNATVSGAIGGCQAEIGVACSMAAAAYNAMVDCNNKQIETAAEIALEHHLGLTCDPVDGYVIIPCIERNSQAILRCLDAALLARNICDIRENKVSFDAAIETMQYTGKKLPKELKETSLGGLAVIIKENSDKGDLCDL